MLFIKLVYDAVGKKNVISGRRLVIVPYFAVAVGKCSDIVCAVIQLFGDNTVLFYCFVEISSVLRFESHIAYNL